MEQNGRDERVRILLAVIDSLRGQLQANPRGAATLDSDLERDLGLDSLAIAELLVRVEQAYGVAVPTRLLRTASTPRDLLTAVGAARPRVIAVPSAEVDAAPVATTAAATDDVDRGPARPALATLVDSLAWHASVHPDRPHLHLLSHDEPTLELTYAGLSDATRTVAAGLTARGVNPGDTVALMLPTCGDYFAAFLGILQAGAIAVPIYPPDRPSRIGEHLQRQRHILDNARVVMLITLPEGRSLSRLLRSRVGSLQQICTPGELTAEGSQALAQGSADDTRRLVPPPPSADDVALLQYTSGSTGNPKGVVLTHRHLVVNIEAMEQAIRCTPEDVFASWLPLYHDMGLIGAWLGSLHTGMTLVSMPPQDFLVRPTSWLAAVTKHRATVMAAPNFAFELCLRRVTDDEVARLDLRSVRLVLNGAEQVDPGTMRRFVDRFAPAGLEPQVIAPVYGLAEAAVGLAFPPPGRGLLTDQISRSVLASSGRAEPFHPELRDEDLLELVACGRALPGYQIRVVDDDGHELAQRLQGHIQFRGPSATSGYLRLPEATSRLFDGDWVRTGDLGYLLDGDIVITGRVKDLIIRAGRNLHPVALERAVGEIEGVRTGCVVVVGAPDPDRGTERLVVLAETRSTAAESQEAIRARIVEVTTDQLGVPPDDVMLVPPRTLPKTSSGKLRRAEALGRYLSGDLRPVPPPSWVQVVRFAAGGVPQRLHRRARYAAASLRSGIAVVLAMGLGITLAVIVAVLPVASWRWRTTRTFVVLAMRLTGAGVRIHGDPAPTGPVVVVANHASWVDGLVLAAVLPGRVRFAVGEVLGSKPLQGFVLRRIGAVFVERHDRAQSVADASLLSRAIARRGCLAVFPEGGLDELPGVRAFRLGAFMAAVERGVPVVPIALRGSRWVLPPGTRTFRASVVDVVIGAPIPPDGTGWEAAVALRDAARSHIVLHCGETDRG